MKTFRAILTVCAWSWAAGGAAAPEYWPIDLGSLGGTNSEALGVNDDRQVVGWSQDAAGRTQAFVWASGTMTGLGFLPGGTCSVANAINNRGDVTGHAYVSGTNHHAFLCVSNSLQDIGTLGGPNSKGLAINIHGDVTGWSQLATNSPSATDPETFVWRSNRLIHIPPFNDFKLSCEGQGINDKGSISGITFNFSPGDSHWWAYVWHDDNGNFTNEYSEMKLLGSRAVKDSTGEQSCAADINNAGQATGWTGVTNTWLPQHAFLVTSSNGAWKLPTSSNTDPTNLLMLDLGTLDSPTNNSFSKALNDHAWIVGTSATRSGTNQAFLWRDGVMTNLNLLIPTNSGWVLTNATGINEYNEIVGNGLYFGQPRAFILQSSPGLALLGTNGMSIADSEPPSLEKGSDFGHVWWGQAATNVFTLRNLGSSNLTIFGWTTNGPDAAHFQISGIPSAIAVGGETNFTVVFAPPTGGVYHATLTIASDSIAPLTNVLFAGTGDRLTQTIDFPALADQWITNSVGLSASANSGLAVEFSVVSGPAQLADGTNLTFVGTGQVAVVAFQSGDSNWNPAPDITNVFFVYKMPAAVFLHDLAQTYDGTARTVSATTEPAGLAVEITYDGQGAAPTNAGSYAVTGTVVEANWEGTTNGTLVVAPADQTIDFPAIGDQWITNSVGLSASADSGLNVEFSVVSGPAQLADGTNLTFVGTGQVAVVAFQSGDSNWNPAPDITNVFFVYKMPAAVFLHDLAQTYDGTARTVSATTEPAGLAVEITYDGQGAAPTNAGSYAVTGTVVEANWEGTTNGTLVVAPADQTIDFPAIGDQFITNVFPLAAMADSGLPIEYAVLYGPARLVDDALVFDSTGQVAVVASQAGDANWNPAPDVTNVFGVWGLYVLSVVSAQGVANPPAGTYTNLLGTVLTPSISAPEPAGGTQYVCVGWTLTGHEPSGDGGTNFEMTVTNDAVLTWRWATNYWLETVADPHGFVAPDSSWQPAGLPAVIVATPAAYYHFEHWTNSASGTNNPFALIMDVPKSARAVFAENLADHDVPEWWLADHGWTNDFDAAARLDFEPDGFATWQEYVADTDPRDAMSFLRITNVVAGETDPVVYWPASTGRAYQVHFCDGMAESLWNTQQLARGIGIWTDTNLPPARRLYRVAPLRP